jgi:hypothetical protein
MLEAQSPGRESIGAALERIQGCDRLMLEEFRRYARRNVVAPAAATSGPPSAADAARARSPLNYAPEMLRERRVVPIDELLRPGGPQSVVENPETNAAPLPPQNPASESGQKAEQSKPAAASEKDPFADDSAKPATESTPPPAPAPVTPPQTAPATPPHAAPATPPQTGPAPVAPTTPPDKKDDNPFGG